MEISKKQGLIIGENQIRGLRGLAEFLDCSVSTAHKYKESGKIPFYQCGKKIYFDREELTKTFKSGAL